MKKILIGASGFLGQYILSSLPSEDILATYNSKKPSSTEGANWVSLDLAELTAIERFCDEQALHETPCQIYFLAALHHPDFVEENPSAAWHINITSLACFLNKLGPDADLIYVSTDNVYGESQSFHAFSEQDHCQPQNEYGRQKRLAEQLVLTKGYKVVRCSFLIGPSKAEKEHFFDFIANTLKGGKDIDLLADSYRSSISFRQTAEILINLMERYHGEAIGIVNVGSDTPISKYEVGLKIAEYLNVNTENVVPIKMNEQQFFKAKRPQNILLDNTKLKRLLELTEIRLEF